MDLHAVTVVSASHLPFARVLAASLRDHNPGARLAALVVDAGGAGHDEPFAVLTAEAIGCDTAELHRRALMYDTQALLSSLKGRLLGAELQRSGGEPVLLLDADILVCGDLGPVVEATRRAGVLLTPHLRRPRPHRPGGGGAEEVFLAAGAYNGGLVGVAGERGAGFAAWWDERSARDCVRDTGRRLLLSQTWLDLAPSLFGAEIFRDAGTNVTGHDLEGLDVARAEGGWTIGGSALRCFHFTGFDPGTPGRLGAREERSWSDLEGRPGTQALAAAYARLLADAGWTPAPPAAGFTRLPDGTALTPPARAAYRAALLAHEAGRTPAPPNPLADGDADRFLAWLAEPVPGLDHPWLLRYLLGVHAARSDVRASWPLVPGEHTEPFLAWCHSELAAQDPLWGAVAARRQ